MPKRYTILFILFFLSLYGSAQQDTTAVAVTKLSLKFIDNTNKKIDKYSSRITSKTEKTLEKLTRWENKIHNLLQKAAPATAERLFGNGRQTFAAMLQKVQEGKTLTENYKASYDEYTDKLTTNIKYMASSISSVGGGNRKGEDGSVKTLVKATQKINTLEIDIQQTETAETLIKQRKKELLTEAYKVIGKSKYLSKINKEAYYYTETLKNYKELFKDPTKAEETAMNILNKIPAAKEFFKNNSMLASLFGNSSGGQIPPLGASLVGLQTRSSVNNLIQGRIAQGGPNAAAQVSQNMQAAQAQLTALKDKIIKIGNGNAEGWDFFPLGKQGGAPNTQKPPPSAGLRRR